MVVVEKAWAKINYFLSVGASRGDGYHDIETLMQTISLYDIVTVSAEEGEGITLTTTANDIPTDERNLAYRAAQVFLSHLGRSLAIDIALEKHIPAAGGLAGGSADAAAVLRALNQICGASFSVRELADMGNEFGSDIAFCVYGGLALCQGRGDIVIPLARTKAYHFLVANSGEKVSTKEAYDQLDTREGHPVTESSAECLAALQKGDFEVLGIMSTNSFEDVVLSQCPLAREMLTHLRKTTPVAGMSGSGASVYGMYETKDEALVAQAALPFSTHYAYTVFKSGERV